MDIERIREGITHYSALRDRLTFVVEERTDDIHRGRRYAAVCRNRKAQEMYNDFRDKQEAKDRANRLNERYRPFLEAERKALEEMIAEEVGKALAVEAKK